MEKFKGSTYSSHNFIKIELIVVLLALAVIVLFAYPKARGFVGKIKLDNAIDSVYSYKESISNFYVSQLLVDSNFKFDGVYTISDGNLVVGDYVYNIISGANAPQGGYLDYQNNVLKNGCIDINGFTIVVENGDIVSASVGSCPINDVEVAYQM